MESGAGLEATTLGHAWASVFAGGLAELRTAGAKVAVALGVASCRELRWGPDWFSTFSLPSEMPMGR